MVKLRSKLLQIARLVADQAERDKEFAERLALILGSKETSKAPKATDKKGGSKRPSHRRSAAMIDPIGLIADGEEQLRAQLEALTLDQLRDIVADYGMDASKLVMKWKDPRRVIDRIVEVSAARAEKGNAFRS